MILYLVQVMLFQVVFLAVYDFFLSKETFHTYNRWYLIGTPILSFVLPLIQISTIKEAIPQEYIILLPEVIVSPQKAIEQTTFYTGSSISLLTILFWAGFALFAIIFLVKLFKVIGLIFSNETVSWQHYKLVLLPKKTSAFSFFNFIFLGKSISEERKKHIIEHELVHVNEKHSLDLLFFEMLRIVMWFNPMIYFYQRRITILHEYISDAKIVKTTERKTYFNNLLSETFQVENMSFINQFYKHSFIKKRIMMITKNKSNKRNQLKYLLLIPVLGSMIFYTSCTQNQEFQEEIVERKIVPQNKSNSTKITDGYPVNEIVEVIADDVPFSIIEEVPIFPGCTGTKQELTDCLNEKIKHSVIKNFNGDISKTLNLPKGRKKIFVFFRINKNGDIVDVNANAPHSALKEEAMRVAKLLPKMQPGKQRGRAVGMRYTLPIAFNVD